MISEKYTNDMLELYAYDNSTASNTSLIIIAEYQWP